MVLLWNVKIAADAAKLSSDNFKVISRLNSQGAGGQAALTGLDWGREAGDNFLVVTSSTGYACVQVLRSFGFCPPLFAPRTH